VPRPEIEYFFPSRCLPRSATVRFDLTTLKLFVSAIDHGSIARAAEREHIVASAASKRIADLETGLGVALLVRQHAGVVPTAAGEALAHQAREVIKTLDRIPDALSTLAADDQPDIRILANQTAVVVVVADLASYIARRPAVKICLDEGQSLPIIESVAQGSADIGPKYIAATFNYVQRKLLRFASQDYNRYHRVRSTADTAKGVNADESGVSSFDLRLR